MSLLRIKMIRFAAYTASEAPNAFLWAGQPPKLPLPLHYLIHDLLGPAQSDPQTAS